MLADIHEECNKHGTVLRVVVPRPPVPAQVGMCRDLCCGVEELLFHQLVWNVFAAVTWLVNRS